MGLKGSVSQKVHDGYGAKIRKFVANKRPITGFTFMHAIEISLFITAFFVTGCVLCLCLFIQMTGFAFIPLVIICFSGCFLSLRQIRLLVLRHRSMLPISWGLF